MLLSLYLGLYSPLESCKLVKCAPKYSSMQFCTYVSGGAGAISHKYATFEKNIELNLTINESC